MRAAKLRGICAVFLLLSSFVGAASAQSENTDSPQQTGKQGMVVAVCPLAAGAGLDAMRRGGNAVDAAVATALVLSVTWPEAGNIGGGGFMLVYRGKDKPPKVVDYRETAPAAATATMFRAGSPSQYRLVGVPGTIAGLVLAHEKFGSLPWEDLVLPAVRLAEGGFEIDLALARSLNNGLRSSDAFREFRRVYGKGAGKWRAGDRLTLPDLARTLRRIATHAREGFYEGATADQIVAEMKAGGGLIDLEDLQKYRAKLRDPVEGTFRGYRLYGPPPPSSGGIAIVEMLNVLENFDLQKQGAYSPATLHLITETMRRVYYDRARFLGDSDFVAIPAHLVSKEYAKQLAAEIDPRRATSSRALSKEIPLADEPSQTTHFSVVDGNGMAVSNTYTLEQSFGSRIVVRGGGFLLNNEMGDFNPQPGVTKISGQIGTDPNIVAPGKRMLSSMTPIIVATPEGDPLIVTGSPGGRTIINTVAGVLLNHLDFKISPDEAVRSPRLHHPWLPDRIQSERQHVEKHATAIEALKAMGHRVGPIASKQGDAHTIWIDPTTKLLHGIPDSRIRGAAKGF